MNSTFLITKMLLFFFLVFLKLRWIGCGNDLLNLVSFENSLIQKSEILALEVKKEINK